MVHCLFRQPRSSHFADDAEDRLALEVPLEDLADAFRLLRVHHQPPAACVQVVAEREVAAGPLAPFARGDLLVARALGDDLALELGERQQDVQRQPAQGRGRVELLGDRDEA